MKKLTLGALAAAALLSSTAIASAASVVALTEDGSLVTMNTESRMAAKTVKVSGASGKLVGIDVRPANGLLYGVDTTGGIYVIDLDSGSAKMVSKLDKTFPAAGKATVDFNPAADRLRLMSSDGTNFRVNVDTGAVTLDGSTAYAKDGPMMGKKATIAAGAYTNSVSPKPEKTALYTVSAETDMLYLQSPPNDGIQQPVGKLGADIGTDVGFDIIADGKGGNMAVLYAMDALHEVDMTTGAVKTIGKVQGVSGKLVDFAFLPAM
ncbi:DUF4394 domain-containing protein [Oceanibaculum pacificum]|uniref:DUF4394 domain-containing protein n=1 Tax=Oceanibaculum pacificum TaxID=580166 RepID=A0A154WF77_9PROT|nr:DUF4394 domain-containing protein [Oceanibaculum pacificum]KZD12177.1 hypothetical protein AUP43_05060 [Oceanibaculum pacificum]